jgi:hypothetical protein
MNKIDYKKEFKELYMPKPKPGLIDVPEMIFIMVDGKGDPSAEEYSKSIEILYALTFTIKMSKMSGNQPEGYFEYEVPPLEGLWYGDKDNFDLKKRSNWLWTSMIRQPEFVNSNVFNWAIEECKKKKPNLELSKARLEVFTEGKCVQMMHNGPFSEESHSIEMLHLFMEENGLRNMTGNDRKHHEIYIKNPKRTAPERLKTIIRLPVE